MIWLIAKHTWKTGSEDITWKEQIRTKDMRMSWNEFLDKTVHALQLFPALEKDRLSWRRKMHLFRVPCQLPLAPCLWELPALAPASGLPRHCSPAAEKKTMLFKLKSLTASYPGTTETLKYAANAVKSNLRSICSKLWICTSKAR